MEAIATRRENVVRVFFWAMLVSVSMMTGYFLLTGGPDKAEERKQAYTQADLQQQIAQYRSALENNPNDLRTLIALGDVYLNGNQNRDAFEIFQRAETVDPNNAHVASDLAGLYQQMGQYDDALERYRRAYDNHPQNSTPLLNMALIYSRHKGEYAAALELLEKFLANNPDPQLAATAEQEIAKIRQADPNAEQ